MYDFDPIVKLLDTQFPGRFSCQPGKHGQANGLNIR